MLQRNLSTSHKKLIQSEIKLSLCGEGEAKGRIYYLCYLAYLSLS